MDWQIVMENENLINSLIAIGIFLLFLIFRKIFSKFLFKFILRLTKKSSLDFLTNLWTSFENPIRWLFVVIGLYVAVLYFPYLHTDHILFTRLYRSMIIILIAWGFYNLSSTSSVIFHKLNNRFNLEIDQIVIPLLSRILRVIVVLIAITIIAQEFDYDINGFIAGLGIGGLAFALAAQDALKNFIAGLVIIFERPFSIGDWILTPSVEGTVEGITFRSTKIRTSAQALVTVPNSTLANENITNWSKMGKRQVTFYLRVEYQTPKEKLERVVRRFDEYLRSHPEVHPETIYVKFDRFGDHSLDIYFYFFTKTTVGAEYLAIKEQINFKILEILEEEGVDIALPTQTLYLEKGKAENGIGQKNQADS